MLITQKKFALIALTLSVMFYLFVESSDIYQAAQLFFGLHVLQMSIDFYWIFFYIFAFFNRHNSINGIAVQLSICLATYIISMGVKKETNAFFLLGTYISALILASIKMDGWGISWTNVMLIGLASSFTELYKIYKHNVYERRHITLEIALRQTLILLSATWFTFLWIKLQYIPTIPWVFINSILIFAIFFSTILQKNNPIYEIIMWCTITSILYITLALDEYLIYQPKFFVAPLFFYCCINGVVKLSYFQEKIWPDEDLKFWNYTGYQFDLFMITVGLVIVKALDLFSLSQTWAGSHTLFGLCLAVLLFFCFVK